MTSPSARGSDRASPVAPRAPRRSERRHSRTATIALIGNPNTGKTALFNALTGYRRHVANYPGVTVDVGRGRVRDSATPLELLDLPGTYSLAAASPDEAVVCTALRGEIAGQRLPDAILAIADASNLTRNLYLASQLLEIGRPVVVALNMVDVAERRGIFVSADKLSEQLGVPVVPVVATRPDTVRPLVAELERAIDAAPAQRRVPLPDALLEQARRVSEQAGIPLTTCEALRVLAHAEGHMAELYAKSGGSPEILDDARRRLAEVGIEPGPVEVRARYAWISEVLDEAVQRGLPTGRGWSDRVDRFLTHRLGGAAVLLIVLYALFYSIYSGAAPLMRAIEWLFTEAATLVAGVLPDGVVESALTDGLLGGVGGVLTFLPQILMLFLFVGILEDCGYMARAAFMVDRLMRPLGLSGRAFIPLLSAFACTVPAIMGTRSIADRRERFITILIAPFMSCSARLPIYLLLIGALVPARAWFGGFVRLDALVMLGMYLLGVVVAIPVAWILKRTAFSGPRASFLLELPGYRIPRPRAVWQRMYLAGRSFLVRAGTVILLVNLLVWALGYFPRRDAVRDHVAEARAAHNWDQQRYQSELAGAYLRDSYLGRIGHTIEPAIRPLGWDWRIGVGVVASFPAREVIIATLGTVFNLGNVDEGAASLKHAVRTMTWEGSSRPLFTLPVALSLMVFFALSAQCFGTLAVIRRETGSWVWPTVSFVGMTTIALIGAWVTTTTGRALGL